MTEKEYDEIIRAQEELMKKMECQIAESEKQLARNVAESERLEKISSIVTIASITLIIIALMLIIAKLLQM